MATPGSPTWQTTPTASSPRRTTYYEPPRPSNLAASRSPSSYSSHAGIASPTAQFHDSAQAGPSSPPANHRHLPPGASPPGSPIQPRVTRLHSSSVSAPSNDHAAVAAALGRDTSGLDEARAKRRWAWRWILLWLTLVLVIAAVVVVGVTVSILKHRQANVENARQTSISSSVVAHPSATSSALVTQKASTSSSAGASAATVPDPTTGPFPSPTSYTSAFSSTSLVGSPTPTDRTGDPFTTGSLQTSGATTTGTEVPATGQ